MTSPPDYARAAAERVLVFDGAFGTYVQTLDLDADAFGGPELEGCNEILCLTRPDVIVGMHETYLDLGVDVIETATFGAFGIPLGEYGQAHQVGALNRRAAEIAVELARGYSTPDRPRWVAGSIGPGTKFASLGQITYVELRDQYEEQALALLEGGVDLFIVETMFDLLGVKAAMNGCRRAMALADREIPIQTQVTIELTGRMLPGTEIECRDRRHRAAQARRARHQLRHGPGRDGRAPAGAVPPEPRADLVHPQRRFAVGRRWPHALRPHAGSAGRSPGPLRHRARRHGDRRLLRHHPGPPGRRHRPVPRPRAGSAHPAGGARRHFDLQPGAVPAGHVVPDDRRTHQRQRVEGLPGRHAHRRLGQCLKIGTEQVKEGAHIIDVCVDYVGRDGAVDMDEIARRFATQIAAPLVLDSTEPEVMEAGLRWIGGRALLNSANLEDGDGEGSRADRVFRLAQEFGAAVICLLIDEEGQARDVEWKLRIAHRIHDLAVGRYGLESSDLVFDALTFPLSTGDDDLRRDGIATIEAIRRIKEELPGVYTTLGLSNVSFGLKPAARHALNSVFLHECVEAGLDSAIVHAGKIVPLSRVPEEQRQVCLDLVWDRRGLEGGDHTNPGYDPLAKLLDVFADVSTTTAVREDRSGWPVERRLSQRIIDGERDGLTASSTKPSARASPPSPSSTTSSCRA